MSAMRSFLNAKIHRATITEADLHYEGSITLPPSLLRASGIAEYEAVSVWNIANGSRFETYAIQGPEESDPSESNRICVNGAAAHLVHPGDLVIVASFVLLTPEQINSHKPSVIFVDQLNRVTRVGVEKAFSR